jgi:hypothetical protein
MDMEQATTGHECKITNHHDMVVMSRLLLLFLNYCHPRIFKLCMTILLSQFFKKNGHIFYYNSFHH